jgi:hypothetical protein
MLVKLGIVFLESSWGNTWLDLGRVDGSQKHFLNTLYSMAPIFLHIDCKKLPRVVK